MDFFLNVDIFAIRIICTNCVLIHCISIVMVVTGLFICLVALPQNINLLKPTGYLMHQQFNIQQLCVLPTLYLCVLYLSENKQRLVTLTA